jgi:hypothetical protein
MKDVGELREEQVLHLLQEDLDETEERRIWRLSQAENYAD